MEPVNIVVIGVGPHARRIYIPILTELSRTMPVRFIGAVDVKSQEEVVNLYFKAEKYSPKVLYLDPFDGSKVLPDSALAELDAFVQGLNVQGVIISTEPTVHKAYAEWALRRGMHILMDKPISVRKFVTTDFEEASELIQDYNDLLALYNESQNTKETIFSINVQRRYEYGFDVVKELITEVKDKFNMPVTSIQAMHADGTWMFPKEVLTQESHRHFDGYGKVAHSGYHIFDMVWQLYEAGLVDKKRPDHLEVLSSSLSPAGLSIDLDEKDYQKYFGDTYEPTGYSAKAYINKAKDYGEMDSFSTIRLIKGNENICNISINLLHSSFSQRSWVVPNADRYKGNGRVKHQQFTIQQGPFQCIQIHNYQSKGQHDVDNSNEFDIGGNNHFDVYVFRNSDMFGAQKSFFKLSSKDLEKKEHSGRLVVEKAKERVIIEFVNFMLGKIEKSKLKSNINTHAMPVKIMSGVYQSSVRLKKQQNPLINITV